MHASQYGAEDFFLVDAHLGRYLVEQRTANVEALVVARHFVAAPVHQQFGALFHADGDVVLDAFQCFLGNDRAHFGIQMHAVLDLQRAGTLLQGGQYFLAYIAHQHGNRDGHAALAGRAVGGSGQCIHGAFDIGVRHDDHVVLGAAQRLYALAEMGAALVYVLSNRRGTHKADGGHIFMFEQGIDHDLVALHHVEHAVGQSGLLEQLRHEYRNAGIALAGLQYESIAGSDGHGKHPARHHAWEVERRDARNDAQRLAHGPVIDAIGNLLGVIALQQLRDAAGEFNNINATGDFTLRIGEDLAVFGRNHGCHGVDVVVHQTKESIDDARAAYWRRVGPRGRSSFGCGHSGLDVFYRRQHHLARDAARGRVVYRLLAIARAGHDGAINEISDIGVVGIGRRRGDGRVLILHGVSLMIGWNETSIGSIPARNKPLLLDSLFNILDNGRLRGAWNETGQTRAIVVPHLLAGHTGHDGQLYRRGPSAGC